MLKPDELSRDCLLTLRADIMLDLGILTEIDFNILKVIIGSSNIDAGIPVIKISFLCSWQLNSL